MSTPTSEFSSDLSSTPAPSCSDASLNSFLTLGKNRNSENDTVNHEGEVGDDALAALVAERISQNDNQNEAGGRPVQPEFERDSFEERTQKAFFEVGRRFCIG